MLVGGPPAQGGSDEPARSRELPEWLAALYPFKRQAIEIIGRSGERHRMHYLDEGPRDAPVLLLLHGNPTWSFYFRRLIPALSADYRVLAVDHIGCGLSSRPKITPLRAAERADHLEQFLDALGIKRFSIIAHDWGGPIGTALATRRIGAVERIVFFNTTLTEVDSLPGIIRRANNGLIGPFLTKYSKHFLKLMCRFGVQRKLPSDVVRGYLFPYRSAADRQAIWDFVDDIPFDSSHPTNAEMARFGTKLPELAERVPVQIIWGLKDPCFHREMLRRVAGHFPHARVLELPHAGHLALEDEPEVCIATIKEFLAGPAKPVMPECHGANPLYLAFSEYAERNPRHTAVVVPEFVSGHLRSTKLSYQELRSLVTQYERGLHSHGLGPRDRVLMLVPPGIDFLALSLAVMGRGAVPVYVDPGIGKEKLLKCISDAAPDAFIGSPLAHVLRLVYRRLFRRLKFTLIVSDLPFIPRATMTTGELRRFSDVPLEPRATVDETAMVACTSGATGTPKGVVFSNEMLAAQLQIFRRDFGFVPGTLDLPLLPIFSLYNVALGVGSVFMKMNPGRPLDLNPREVLRIAKDLGIRSSFGSPTLWDRISRYAETSRERLEPIERVLMAGVAVPAAVRQRVTRLLRDGGMSFTPYGATEALPVTQVSSRELDEHTSERAKSGEQGVYVGKPVSGVDVRVIPVTSGPIENLNHVVPCAPYEVGEVIVAGASVSKRYLSRPDANRNGKIPGPDGRLWHRMGDCGYLDQAGGLYFCGRVAHRQFDGMRPLYSVPTEGIFAAHPKVARAALVGLAPVHPAHRDGTDTGSHEPFTPAIVIEPMPESFPADATAESTFRQQLEELGKAAQLPRMEIFFHPRFPVDARHNAKVFNDQLGEWASEQRRVRDAVQTNSR